MRVDLRLYLVADPAVRPNLVPGVAAAISGGVTAVQLRAKSGTDRERIALGRALRRLTADAGVPLLVNDRLDIALAIGADGVHLGVHDLPPADARRIGPAGYLIGYSPDDADDRSGSADADYYGIGPVFGTSSKADAGAALGLDSFADRVARAGKPVIGIGGVDAGNAASVVARGAVGVAVLSAVLAAPEPAAAARAIRDAVDHALAGAPSHA